MNLESLFKTISDFNIATSHPPPKKKQLGSFLTEASRPICCPGIKKTESEIFWACNITEWETGAVFLLQVELIC
jgi:hypothetical protein